MRRVFLSALALAGLAAAPAWAAGDAAAGKVLFTQKCSICHAPVEGQNKIGPSLWAWSVVRPGRWRPIRIPMR